jgi:hypothetical protein
MEPLHHRPFLVYEEPSWRLLENLAWVGSVDLYGTNQFFKTMNIKTHVLLIPTFGNFHREQLKNSITRHDSSFTTTIRAMKQFNFCGNKKSRNIILPDATNELVV